MKTSLSYLPKIKQDQILQVVDIIREVANPEKIVLFGSYAKGKYVEHRYTGRNGINYEYSSDYDFLVVTENNPGKIYELDERISALTPDNYPALNIEIHEIEYINEGLEFGQYFFSDIVKEGILLYDTGKFQFTRPKELTAIEEREIAQRYYDTWFVDASDFIDGVLLYQEKEKYKKAIFLLHQAVESFYYSTLLVFTGYKPKTHNLYKLRKQAKLISHELFFVFPAETNKHEKHLFDLLKRGYVDARYRTDYFITEQEFEAIFERVKQMQHIVDKICKERIAAI